MNVYLNSLLNTKAYEFSQLLTILWDILIDHFRV